MESATGAAFDEALGHPEHRTKKTSPLPVGCFFKVFRRGKKKKEEGEVPRATVAGTGSQCGSTT